VAVEVKIRTASSQTLTDLRPGKTRKTIYSPTGQLGAMTAFMLGIGAPLVASGVARMFVGTTDRAKAREALQDELTAAEIAGEKAKADEIRAKIALIAREFDPTSEAERAARLRVIEQSLPLDLSRKEVSLEEDRANLERADRLFPLVLAEREAAVETLLNLGVERAERQVEFLQTERAKRDALLEQTERQALLNDQLDMNNQLIAAAIGPLDSAQLAQFAREVLFPPGKPEKIAPIGALSVPRMALAGAGF
jgi:hypothetical protein